MSEDQLPEYASTCDCKYHILSSSTVERHVAYIVVGNQAALLNMTARLKT